MWRNTIEITVTTSGNLTGSPKVVSLFFTKLLRSSYGTADTYMLTVNAQSCM